ncbi:MAG: PAS domain S-box protein [Nitrospirae bacterium]|nr:PAS domain S-box protein [Nitrospirota bacterium]
MIDTVLIKKLKALTSIRVIFISLLLGSFFLLQVRYSNFPHPRAISNLIVALYVLTIIYSVLLNRIKIYVIFAYIQLFVDALATNILIYLTGGIESWFSFIMLLTVMSASTVLNKRAGYIIATFNSILYGAIIDLQYYKLLPVEFDTTLIERDFLYNIFVHISAFYLVAFLSGYLSSRLEKTTEVLEQTDSDLKELTLFSEELIENIPSGIFTTDTDGYILVFNKAAEDITDIERKIAQGKKIDTVFPFIEHITDIERAEGVIRHNKGDRIISLSISSLKDIRGERIGFIGIFQDLTQFKKMEAEIKNKEKLAAIGELSASIAHEIRNPLASLKGSVEMLLENRVAEEYKEKLMEIALKEMERLNKIITDFLTYSRPTAAEFTMFDLDLLLDDTLELLKNTTAQRENISIRKDFYGNLKVTADPQKLQQVFWNLGMNAIEAMSSGGELKVSTRRENNFIEVVFQDTGVGIAKEDMGKIFYPFFTTKIEGTGLGLALAYKIIEEHKGKISVISKQGESTTVKVLIPQDNGKSK